MANDVTPTWFYDMARAAGKDVRHALERGPGPSRQTVVHFAFEYNSLMIESPVGEVNSLERCKEEFETQVNTPGITFDDDVSLNCFRRCLSSDIARAT